jgi:D-beta-D-heptose 7-phosphate kinase/D-beta-D-heptose 1-phosphate adenosyltransferase
MIVLVSGGMDPLHVGHLNLIEGAAELGRVYVALNSDDWLTRKKGRPFMPWADRARILRALKLVTEVIPVDDHDGTVCHAIGALHPHIFANGGDRTVGETRESALCRLLGVHEAFNVGGGKIRSSSELIKAAS